MPKHKGLQRTTWMNCARCGFVHPTGMLTKQKGRMLCSCHGCLDKLDVERRQRLIAECLAKEELSQRDRADRLAQPSEEPLLEF